MTNAADEIKVVKRSSGHSAVAAAAYRSGEKLYDERTGEFHDYSKRYGVVHSEIVLPSFLSSTAISEWMTDREQLWNKVEASDKHPKATIARDWVIPLPHELDDQKRLELTREIASYIADRHSVICDFAIHRPGKEGDERNHHAHILMTTKQVIEDEQGNLDFRVKKSQTVNKQTIRFIPLDYQDGRGGEEVVEMQADIDKLFNDYLEDAGSDKRMTHVSYKEQGLETKPQVHMGKDATALERKGIETEKGNYNRWVHTFNEGLERVKETVYDFYSNVKESVIDIYHQYVKPIEDLEREREHILQQQYEEPDLTR